MLLPGARRYWNLIDRRGSSNIFVNPCLLQACIATRMRNVLQPLIQYESVFGTGIDQICKWSFPDVGAGVVNLQSHYRFQF
jgi:hypothetical protein